VKLIDDVLDRVDRIQQRRPALGFPFAVVKKFGDDHAGNLASLLALYGFLSMFLLLVVFVTILGFVLHGNTTLQHRLLHSVLGQFPVIGNQIKVHSLSKSGVALVVGIVGTLYSGLGWIRAAENAMNDVWDVPRKRRPNFLSSMKRALLMLGALGLAIVAATALSGLATATSGFGVLAKICGVVAATALNVGVFLFVFKILTVAEVRWKDALPGAIVAGVVWEGLQLSGTYLVAHQVKNASPTYGIFALVIGLLWWLKMGAQVTLYAAEINVVRARHLWPRALRNPPGTDADEVTLRREAKQEERVDRQTVDVRFDHHPPEQGMNPPGGG
jgi:YihY family inner membrane protein